eukprot:TRINITY_DN25789_c0_g1_i1.p1 TRINITY_DN25789_c0_g1~~TRINITY_DN25789_c0_g1_i1.p1  ORF type:complete len:573 (+),score=123.12 TRINITY_DN25789_c0_g1_i1:144-1862(+)
MPRATSKMEEAFKPPGQVDDEDEAPMPPSKPPPAMHHEEDAEEDDEEDLQASRSTRSKKKKGFDPDDLGPFRYQCYRLLTWSAFDTVMGIIIILNGVTIGIETQTKVDTPLGCNKQCECTSIDAVCTELPAWLSYAEYGFSISYFLELVLRVIVYTPQVFIDSGWVRLDLLLVVSSAIELVLTQVDSEGLAALESMDLVRMLRLARLARAVRLIHMFQTLWMLVQGLMYSVNTLLWTALLTAVLIYIFAIVGLELITVDLDLPLDHPYNIAAVENFRDLADASMLLLQCFSWDSISGVYRPIIKHRFYLFFYFITFLLVMSIALMNLVTAIMVEGSLDQGNEDKETHKAMLAQKKIDQMVELKRLFLELDEDGSGELSMEEIDAAPEEMRDQLVEIAGTEDIKNLFDMLDYDGGGTLGVEEFCDGILRATSSEKPMELDRLVKQCGDVFVNSRRTIKVLKGQDPDAPEDEDQEDMEDGNGAGDDDADDPPPRKESKDRSSCAAKGKLNPEVETYINTIEGRVNGMEDSLADMQADVREILDGMLQICSSTRSPNSGVKKAIAVCRGPVHTIR